MLEYEKAVSFYKYTQRKATGFSANGVVISYQLGMALFYPLMTAIFSVILPMHL